MSKWYKKFSPGCCHHVYCKNNTMIHQKKERNFNHKLYSKQITTLQMFAIEYYIIQKWRLDRSDAYEQVKPPQEKERDLKNN